MTSKVQVSSPGWSVAIAVFTYELSWKLGWLAQLVEPLLDSLVGKLGLDDPDHRSAFVASR